MPLGRRRFLGARSAQQLYDFLLPSFFTLGDYSLLAVKAIERKRQWPDPGVFCVHVRLLLNEKLNEFDVKVLNGDMQYRGRFPLWPFN